MSGVSALVARDVRLAWRTGGGALSGLLFFLAVVSLVPFALGPDAPLLRRVGPGVVWLGALLASLLGLERVWAPDREDGSLDALRAGGLGPAAMAFAKGLAHWIAHLLPLVVASPLLGLLANQGAASGLRTALSLLLGTPALAALGTVGAAVAVTLPRGGLLTALIVLPLAVPTLIFGVAAAGEAGRPGALALLAALSLFAWVTCPFLAGAALRMEGE